MEDKQFSLCSTCAERQSDETKFTSAPAKDCFICRGLSLRIPEVERRVLREVIRYQSKSFSVGMIVPPEVQEREDQLRSDLQIRGMETIKSQSGKEIADFVRRKTKRRIDRKYPELTILVDLERDEISATAKSLFVHGRYTKPRGVSQRKELCGTCSGKGCGECRGGYVDAPSIEETVAKRLARLLRSSRTKFTWIGSEDIESVVYPPGRPFIVEVKNPKLRKIPARFTMVTGRGAVKVTGARVLKGKPKSTPSFVFTTRALIESLQPIDEKSLGNTRKLRGAVVQYRNNKERTVYKKVYSIHVERKGKGIVAEIKLDGGLPVKRLVSGESASPSLSEVVNAQLTCQRFDILRVWESGPLKF